MNIIPYLTNKDCNKKEKFLAGVYFLNQHFNRIENLSFKMF